MPQPRRKNVLSVRLLYKCMLLFLLVLSTQHARADPYWLDASQLQGFFSGSTVRTEYLLGGKTTKPYYAPNGKLYLDNGTGRVGLYADWSIDNQKGICTKSLHTNMCVRVSYDGSKYTGWTDYEGRFQPVFILRSSKGDGGKLAERFKEDGATSGLPTVVFVGPDGKPLPGQRHLHGKEALESIRKGLGAVFDMAREDADFAIACREAGGYTNGVGSRTCYKRY